MDMADITKFDTYFQFLEGQSLFKIKHKNDPEQNFVLISEHSMFCNCQVFISSLREQENALPCKHIISCHLSKSFNSFLTERIDEE